MLRWSERALKALPHLLRGIQDVDVYIEDETGKVLFQRLLHRIAGDRLRIRSVTPLNGRANVIAAAKAIRPTGLNPCLYIIDGDFEWVRNESPPAEHNLFRIPAYCIENLFICESTFLKILEEETGKEQGLLREEFDFDRWLSEFSEELVKLYIAYAVVNKVSPSEPTIGKGVLQLVHPESEKGFCPIKLQGQREQVLEKVKGSDTGARIDEMFELFYMRACALNQSLNVVSGKAALMPIIVKRFRRCGANIKINSLLRRMANIIALQSFASLEGALLSIASKRRR